MERKQFDLLTTSICQERINLGRNKHFN